MKLVFFINIFLLSSILAIPAVPILLAVAKAAFETSAMAKLGISITGYFGLNGSAFATLASLAGTSLVVPTKEFMDFLIKEIGDDDEIKKFASHAGSIAICRQSSCNNWNSMQMCSKFGNPKQCFSNYSEKGCYLNKKFECSSFIVESTTIEVPKVNGYRFNAECEFRKKAIGPKKMDKIRENGDFCNNVFELLKSKGSEINLSNHL